MVSLVLCLTPIDKLLRSDRTANLVLVSVVHQQRHVLRELFERRGRDEKSTEVEHVGNAFEGAELFTERICFIGFVGGLIVGEVLRVSSGSRAMDSFTSYLSAVGMRTEPRPIFAATEPAWTCT